MDLRKLKKLIDLVEESGITELEVTEGEERVRIAKQPLAAAQQTYMMPAAAPLAAAPVAAPAADVAQKSALPEGQVVKSPMVGTFYRAPSPESAAYVENGTEINPDMVICIIEAMKVMNEIKAESRCRILKIMVENGRPVTAGQVLFHIEPA